MPGEVIRRSTVEPLLSPGLIDVLFDEYTKVPNPLEPLLKSENSERSYEEWTEMTGIGQSEIKPEGEGVVFKSLKVQTPTRVSHVTYGLAVRHTMEAKQDELYGKMSQLSRELGKSFPTRRHMEMANLFNLSFLTIGNTAFDGLALCSTSHAITNGSGFGAAPSFNSATATSGPARSVTANPNRLASNADLSYQSLQDMVTLSRLQMDEQGDYVSWTPKYLVVAPANEMLAYAILNTAQKPGSTDNDKNVLTRFNLQVVTSPYLQDPDAWWLLCDRHDLRFFRRMELASDTEDEFLTGDTLHKAVERWSLGFHGYRGVFGTPGL